jgi:hypothetical protein
MVRRCAYLRSGDVRHRHGKDETGPESGNGARCDAPEETSVHVRTVAITLACRNEELPLAEHKARRVRFSSDLLPINEASLR